MKSLLRMFVLILLFFALTACADPVREISFESNGGSNVQSIEVISGERTELPEPNRDGYQFVGWFVSEEANASSFTSSTSVDQDITLFARWERLYSISFESNGGTAQEVTQATAGTTLNLPIPEREGHTFTGWFVDESLSSRFSNVSNPLMPAENLNLYAGWRINKYRITFDSTGGSNILPVEIDFEGSLSALSTPLKAGHIFVGWYTDEDLTQPLDDFTMPARNLTLYAKWDFRSYTLSYYESSYPKMISFGTAHSVLFTSDNRLFTWGNNFFAQLGDETTLNRNLPGLIMTLNPGESFVDISTGQVHSAALTSSGRLFMWGTNIDAQLGDGTYLNRDNPVEISNNFNLRSNEKIISVSLGLFFSSSLTSDGRVFVWGSNGWGELTLDLDIEDSNIPIDITNAFNLNANEKIIEVKSGGNHSAAISSQGRIFTWGSNTWGQLGISEDDLFYSLDIIDITDNFDLVPGEIFESLALGFVHSMALTSSGRLFVWGSNVAGQIGIGDEDLVYSHEPIDLTELFNQFYFTTNESIILIESGRSHNMILTSEGRLFAWGYNEFGQVGDRTEENAFIPVNISRNINFRASEKIVSIHLGENVSSIITSLGRVFTWGENVYGQLGDETFIDSNRPIEITRFIEVKDQLITEVLVPYTSELSLLVPARENYTFAGWYTNASLTTPFELDQMPARNIKLYAKWIID